MNLSKTLKLYVLYCSVIGLSIGFIAGATNISAWIAVAVVAIITITLGWLMFTQ